MKGSANAQTTEIRVEKQQQTQPALPKPAAASGSSSGHSGAVMVDHREDVWPKLQVLQGKYLQRMHDLSGLVIKMGTVAKSEEQLKKVRGYEEVLHRIVSYLIVTKERLPRGFNQARLEALEKSILSVVDDFRRVKTSK